MSRASSFGESAEFGAGAMFGGEERVQWAATHILGANLRSVLRKRAGSLWGTEEERLGLGDEKKMIHTPELEAKSTLKMHCF